MTLNEPCNAIVKSICPVNSCENYTEYTVGNIRHAGCKFKQQNSVRPCALYREAPCIEKDKEKNQ
jgi:hypothetical protein